MSKDQVIIRELRQKNNIQSETIDDYASFFRWMYERIETYKHNCGDCEPSRTVIEIEDHAWIVSMRIRNRIVKNGKDPNQKNI